MVGVEPLGDRVVPELPGEPPGEDLRHDGCASGVGDEAGLGGAFGGLGGDRVVDLVCGVAVRGFADVPPLVGVDLEPVPRAFEHVGDVPLGDALLDAPGEQPGGAFAAQVDRLVGGAQPYAVAFEFVFDVGADVGAAGDPVDGLADHRGEAAAGVLCLG